MSGTKYLVPGTSTSTQVPGTWYFVPGTRYQVPVTWCLVTATWYHVLLPGTWYGTRTSVEMFRTSNTEQSEQRSLPTLVIRRIQQTKNKAMPHLISAELRFPEHLETFKQGTAAYNYFLRNFDDRTIVWSVLKFTSMSTASLCSAQRTVLLQKIYNYGITDMFKCKEATHAAAAAITDWTYIRRAGETRTKATPENKMIVDYVKSLLQRDTIFSVSDTVFEAAVHPVAPLTGLNVCTALCEHISTAHHTGDIVPVPHDQMQKHVFLKVVNLSPEMRHLQHVAGSEGWSSYIVVNKLVDCVQLHDDTLAFCRVDPEPISFKVDSAFVSDCILALKSLSIWHVSIFKGTPWLLNHIRIAQCLSHPCLQTPVSQLSCMRL
jgi:hypothetical protein